MDLISWESATRMGSGMNGIAEALAGVLQVASPPGHRPWPEAPDDHRPPDSSTLFSRFDPTVDRPTEAPEGDTQLRLPVRGVRRVRVDLGKLTWSLSPPLYVWVPRPLSQVADNPEYDLELEVVVSGPRWTSARSKPIRVRIAPP